MIEIRNPRVIAAIIDCFNLPVSKKCDYAVFENKGRLTFIYDEWEKPQDTCSIWGIWAKFEIGYFGPIFTVWRQHDIGDWKIDCTTGKTRWICCYNKEGELMYGRYYQSSMD
jgi:hypothetical protein